MKLTIRSKILFYILFPLVLIFLAFIFITENLIKNEELSSIDKQMSVYCRALADKINVKLREVEMIAISGADFVTMSEFVNDEEAYTYLESNQKRSDLVLGSRFAFNETYNRGKVRVNSISMIEGKPLRSELSPLIKFSEPWYQIPTSTMKPHWSEPFVDRETKVACSRVSVPILKSGKIIGVASARIDLTKFKAFVDTTIYKSINYVIVSNTGQFIFHPNEKRILNDNILSVKGGSVSLEDLKDMGQKMLAGNTGKTTLRRADISEDNFLAYYNPIELAGWSVSVFVKESEILAKSHARRRNFLIIGFFTVLIFLIIAQQLSNRITNPLKQLTAAITKISESKEYKQVEFRSSDELYDLARSFNTMTEAIQKNENELHKLNEDLEAKVEERTRSLEETLKKHSTLNARLKAINMAINAAAIVSLTDIKGDIIEVNEEFCKVSKYTRDELLGKNHRVLNSGYHPAEFFRDMWKTIASGRAWRGQVKNKAKDGSFYWVDSVIVPILGEDGKPIQYLSMRFDITDRKEIERKIDHINKLSDNALELTVAGTWEIDLLDQEWYTSSERAAKIFGDLPSEGHRYKLFGHWAECVKAGDAEYAAKTFQIYADSLEGKLPRYDAVYAYKRPVDGKIAWIHAIGEIERDATGKAIKMYGVSQDITEIKNAEHALLVAKAEADQANSAKSEFLARMSHEIRTPMNAIIGMTYLTLKTELNDKQRENLNKVHSSGIALLSIINDILDFSKIESGKLQIEHTEFNLEKVFNDLSNIVTYKAHEKGLEFVIGLSPGIPPTLIGDPLRLNQILINLSNNAIKFTSDGEIIIKAEVAKKENNRIKILFTVKDSGIGLSQEQVGNLFKSFSQADASTTRKYGGTGLGLAISKSLAELMGGEIWVESKVGKGSSFLFTIWFESGKEKTTHHLLPAIDLRGMKVLVCDDNEASCEILKEALESFSFHVVTVTSGKEAIRELEKNADDPFELVLMDWKMPELNGLDAVKLIKSDKKIEAPPVIIMVTAYNSLEISSEAEKIGVANTLIKPVSYSTLFDTIMQSFGKKEVRKKSRTDVHVLSDDLLAKLKGAKVLLVEDNEINQDVATGMLEAVGITAEIANNGKIAVEMVKASGNPSKYELIIMDLQMPEMDGYEASRQINKLEDFKHIPIFAMTADAVTGVKENCFKAGMIDFVSKPIVPEKLYSTLAKWIKSKAGNEAGTPAPSSTTEKKKTTALPAIEGLNLTDGLNRMNNNTELYLNLLTKFSKNYSGFVSELKSSLAKENAEESKRMVHTLKGVAGNIGAEGLHQFMIGLETKLKQQTKIDLNAELSALENLLNPLLASINQVLNKGETTKSKTAAETKIDPNQLKKLLEELRPLVLDNDFEASAKAKALAELTANSTFATDAKSINASITNYDYEAALKVLDKLINTI